MGKRKIILFVLIILCLTTFTGCYTPSDLGWVYELPNGYSISVGGATVWLISASDKMVSYHHKSEKR